MQGPDNIETKRRPQERWRQVFATVLIAATVLFLNGCGPERDLHKGTAYPTHQVGASKVPDPYHPKWGIKYGGATPTPTISAIGTITLTATATSTPNP